MIQIFKAAIWFLCIHETDVGVILHEGLFLNSPAVLQTIILRCMNVHIQVPPVLIKKVFLLLFCTIVSQTKALNVFIETFFY